MRITCPSCAAEYDVPASRLPPHKMVRCARCGGEWVPVQEAVEATAAEAKADSNPDATPDPDPQPASDLPAPVIAATDRLVRVGSARRSQIWLISAWVMTFIFLGASLAAMVVWRADIVRIWPPSARILASGAIKAATPEQIMGKKAE